jgi:hypothetical protein
MTVWAQVPWENLIQALQISAFLGFVIGTALGYAVAKKAEIMEAFYGKYPRKN